MKTEVQQQNDDSGRGNVVENTFVSYVNSLHCLDGDCDGALAERQAREPYFCQIQVAHPIVLEIYTELIASGGHRHVILTGHAGDGKSTIALELYKHLCAIPADKPLEAELPRQAEIGHGHDKIVLIKDLSEWTESQQNDILLAMRSGSNRYFLISNTGCLLALFRRHAESLGRSAIDIEGELLTAMDSGERQGLDFDGLHVSVHNLALHDNTDIAMALWDKLTSSREWDKCKNCSMSTQCPIYKNLTLIQKYGDIIRERLRLLLKRTREYGGHLTMRQMTAHFAYMLCSGHSCAMMHGYSQNHGPLKLGDFLFFNHFFGDNADGSDERAKQLRAVKVIRNQGFETLQAPAFERYLWLHDKNAVLAPGIAELEPYYKALKSKACGENAADKQSVQVSVAARRQIRRMFFFLYAQRENSSHVDAHFDTFLRAFLNSPMLLEYEKWRKNQKSFVDRRAELLEQLFQVLQEQFCNVHLPEHALRNQSKILYITLARRQQDIRQGAQIVLGKIDFHGTFTLKLEKEYIYLTSKKQVVDLCLELPLPFLDYIANRKNGRVGTFLQLSYIDRLEKFKKEILAYAKISDQEGLVLLSQKADHELFLQRLCLANKRLEVSNG